MADAHASPPPLRLDNNNYDADEPPSFYDIIMSRGLVQAAEERPPKSEQSSVALEGSPSRKDTSDDGDDNEIVITATIFSLIDTDTKMHSHEWSFTPRMRTPPKPLYVPSFSSVRRSSK